MSPGAWQETGTAANRKRGEEGERERALGGARRGRAAGATEEMSNGWAEVKGTEEKEEGKSTNRDVHREYQREIKVLKETAVVRG